MARVPWSWLSPHNPAGGGPSAPRQGWTGARMHLSTRIHAPTDEARPGGQPFLWPTFPDCPGAKARGECGVLAATFISLKALPPREGNQTGRQADKQTGVQTAGLTWGRKESVFKVTATLLPRSQQTGPTDQTWPTACFYKVLLKHKYISLYMIYGCFHAPIAEQELPQRSRGMKG